MQRLKVIKNNEITVNEGHGDLEVLTNFIAFIEKQNPNRWGIPETLKPTIECSQDELDNALEIIPAVIEQVENIVPAVIDPETEEVLEEATAIMQDVVITPEMARIAGDYEIIIEDMSAEIAAEKAKQDKIEAGKKAREICQKALDYIAGENLDRELTLEQITTMQNLFSDTENALRAARPTLALSLISAIEPDEVLITSSLKDAVINILNE